MFKKFIDKVGLLARLYLFKQDIKIENWNEFTKEWSKGYKKGAEEVIHIVETYDEEVQ